MPTAPLHGPYSSCSRFTVSTTKLDHSSDWTWDKPLSQRNVLNRTHGNLRQGVTEAQGLYGTHFSFPLWSKTQTQRYMIWWPCSGLCVCVFPMAVHACTCILSPSTTSHVFLATAPFAHASISEYVSTKPVELLRRAPRLQSPAAHRPRFTTCPGLYTSICPVLQNFQMSLQSGWLPCRISKNYNQRSRCCPILHILHSSRLTAPSERQER